MIKFTPSFSACAALILLGVGVAPLANATYNFTDLSTLGDSSSYAYAINNAGQVVGSNSSHAILWNGATATDLGTLGGSYSNAAAINNAGQVAGAASTTGDAGSVATVWNGATATQLGDPSTNNYTRSGANAINNTGQAVGTSTNIYDGFPQPTLWNGATTTYLGPSYSIGIAFGINNAGQAAGWTFTNSNLSDYHANLWNAKTPYTATYLFTPGGSDSAAYAINNAGHVAGETFDGNGTYHVTLWNGATTTYLGPYSRVDNGIATAINNVDQVAGYSWTTDPNPAFHATLWTGGTSTDLNSLLPAKASTAGWVLTTATGINDKGWIVGNDYNSITGLTHGFLLTPAVPEPETYAMMLAGLGLLGFTVWRRKDLAA